MSADTLVSKLDGVQGRGPRWRAICPAHESKHHTRSLSILETSDGRVLMRCFAGCAVEAICGAVGVDLSELFPPRDPRNLNYDANRPPPLRKPWTTREIAEAMEVDLTSAFLLLRKVGAGARLSKIEIQECTRAAEMCALFLHEIIKG
jgi:hypothetical protein